MVPSEEVRMVALSPTVTNVLFTQVIPTRLYVVPEILLSQAVPSEEVRMVPTSPTVTNNPLELGDVTSSSLPPHEIMVRLKMNTEIIMKIYLTWFSILCFDNN